MLLVPSMEISLLSLDAFDGSKIIVLCFLIINSALYAPTTRDLPVSWSVSSNGKIITHVL